MWLNTYLVGRLRARLGDSPPPGDGADSGLYPIETANRGDAFGFASQSPSGDKAVPDSGGQPAPRRVGKASSSVSIFSRDPICKNTCRYCRCQPCDVGVEHDDHTCYSCEQRLLHPEGVPGAPWRPPLMPGCKSWCAHCTSQRCAVRGFHELHVCMGCEHAMKISTPEGGGDPWAAHE